MTNDENSVLDDMKGWLRDRGITKSNLKSYKYYLPYLVGNGRAGTPQSVTFELTLRCNLSCQMCPLDLPRIMHDKSDPDFIKSRQQAELSTEICHYYVARDLEQSHQELEASEQISVHRMPLVDARRLLVDQECADGMSLTGLVLLDRWIQRGERS